VNGLNGVNDSGRLGPSGHWQTAVDRGGTGIVDESATAEPRDRASPRPGRQHVHRRPWLYFVFTRRVARADPAAIAAT